MIVPSPLSVYVPSPGTVIVFCCPGVNGSKSTVVSSIVPSGSVSLFSIGITIETPGSVEAVSSIAIGVCAS